ncbi:CCKAR [Mytilus coruscus]|uniref:CCKAR n=1 Tax=Mytilus coruscus TaxID=42192 RepID=A0A6J8C5D6_MYTCO|nr:CCKAR [Mytilus coruscus]
MALHFTNGTYTSLSEIEYKRFLDQGIPATICLSFLCIVGTIGNIHMILIFKISPVMTKYSIRVFIIWLSLTDLIACLFCMPLEIYNIRYSYTTSISGCKFFIFLFHVVALASSGFWTTIAVERYRIIVKKVPILFLNSQRSNNVISAVVVGVSLALSIPVVILFGPNEIKTVIPGLTGKDCTVLSQYLNIHNAGIYYIIILSTLCSVFAVVCIVSYGRVLWDICNGIKIRKSLRGKSSSSFNSPTHTRFGNTHVNSSIQNEEIQTIHVPAEMGHRTNTSHNLENSLRLIVSLVIATTVSYIAYMLFVCMIMVKLLNPKLYKTTIQPVTAILLRGYFGSNTSNAFVFCLFDRNFRQEWLKLYRKIRSKIISRRLETV